MRALRSLRHFDRIPEILRCRRHTNQWLKLTCAYVGLPISLPFRITLPSGEFEFRESGDIATFWQIFYRQIYSVSSADRLIVDAGANIGAFSLYALTNCPAACVIAIEPAPDSCARIRSLLRAHSLQSRCSLHEAALGSSTGETTIQLDAGSQFRRSGIPGHRVQMKTLESLIPQSQNIDLLKVDIEGAEYDVFKSISPDLLKRVRRIIMEYHPVAAADEAIEPLLSSGFQITRHQDDGGGYGVVWLSRGSG